MMRSLWSGVTGLQAHQIAMDVEGNNIANVNTVGFKYNRANFDDLIYQNSRIATAPQNQHGGVNNMEVGLGTQINSTTRIFKQGSLQTTDKQTDIALQGDGFFMVSSDGGKTTYYTRNGDFSRDSEGNFVDNGGNIVQGWMRDEETGEIDPTRPIGDIKIPVGLTVPARATTNIALKGNLDSGNDVGNKKIPIYKLDQHHNGVDLDNDGTIAGSEVHDENNVGANRFYVNKNGEQRMTERGADLGVLFNSNGDAYNLRDAQGTGGQGIWASYADAKTNALNLGAGTDGTFTSAKTLNITLNGKNITGNNIRTIGQLAGIINGKYSETGVEASVVQGNKLVLTNRNNLGTTANMKNIKMTLNTSGPADDTGLTKINIITAYQYVYNKTHVSTTHAYDDTKEREVTTTEDLREAMQRDAREFTNYTHEQNPAALPPTLAPTLAPTNENKGVEVTVNEHGQFQFKNPEMANAKDMNIAVTGLTNATKNVTENVKFTASMAPISGSLSAGGAIRVTDNLNMAAHSSSTDLYDSLGTKHNVKMDFIKRGYTENGGTEWTMVIQVAEPNSINTVEPRNVVTGYVRFNPDGSLATYSPASITFGAQNGSAIGQHIELKFGTTQTTDGLTSTDNNSSTADISQDGYASGELNGIRIDQSGTLVGSFTNGRSLGLAQVGVAKFANNQGLAGEGGNLFSRTANSGDPIIGAAQTAGRGKISASSLEMSNVDLSRSLTQLIVVQRGFQANSKTITTSDEMLNTLLQLK
ncbi:flagellar hook protein FlgE [uncultured Campylobacter sp.]|uniref:flagellar hook protein FlgE n=1 Tax=uncultured Campylobacter sp. TaxID=218934 RepID=UPI002621A2C3|nr:flagellar hook protein FlgE [uncultured Campylobacter sp.]